MTAPLGLSVPAISWPWPVMSRRFGPVLPGHLVSLIASTGAGKTTFVTSALAGWEAAGIDFALISTESPRQELRRKMAAAAAGIPEEAMARADWSGVSNAQRAAYERRHAVLESVMILGLSDFGEKTVGTLQETIANVLEWFALPRLVGSRRLRMLVVDHLHELIPRRGETQLEAWANGVLMLRDMATTEGVAVLLVVQPKRPTRESIPAMYRMPDLHDARGVPQVETCTYQAFGLRRCLRIEEMDAKGRREAIAEITANRRTVHDYAIPWNEVCCLKHRVWGEVVNRTARLRLQHGQLIDPDGHWVPF